MKESSQSAGGIIVSPHRRIVLIEQWGNSWSFPKGTVEEGETLRETAAREIREETGLKDLTHVADLGSYERYSIAPGGKGETTQFGLRRRTFFLYTSEELPLLPEDSEISQARWVTVEEALALLTHPRDREFLASIRSRIEG